MGDAVGRPRSRRSPRALILAVALAQLGCARACYPHGYPHGYLGSAVNPGQEEGAKRPAPLPEPSASERCSFEEAQRLTKLLERERAAELREMADRSGSTALSMVPLRLRYDGAGQVEAARFRIEGHEAFARALEQAAPKWRLDRVHRAATCDLAVQLPRSEVLPDAGEEEAEPEP